MRLHLIRLYLYCLLAAFAPKLWAQPSTADTTLTVKEAEALLSSPIVTNSTIEKSIVALNTLKSVKTAEEMRKYTIQTLTSFAWEALNLKRFDLADVLFGRAQKYCAGNDSTDYFNIYSGLAYIELSEGAYDASYAKLRQTLAYYERHHNVYRSIITMINMATYYRLIDNKARAKKILDKAYRMAVSSRQPLLRVEVLLTLFTCCEDTELDIKLIEEAVAQSRAHNFVYLYPKCQLALARYYDGKLKDEQALVTLDNAIELSRKYADSEGLEESLKRKGDIYARRNNYQLAFYLYRQSTATKSQNEEKTKSSIQRFMLNSRKLLAWCDKNVKMEHGEFKIVREDDGLGFTKTLFLVVVIVMLAGVVFVLWRKKQVLMRLQVRDHEELDSLKKQDSILRKNLLELKTLVSKMEHDITYLLLFYNNHNVLLDKIRNSIRQAYGKDSLQNGKLRNICAFIMENRLEPISTQYTAGYQETMAAYQKRLLRQYPKLSKNELQLASYIYMGLSTHEICIVTGNQPQSINVARYRLRKSMNLDGEVSLEQALKAVGNPL